MVFVAFQLSALFIHDALLSIPLDGGASPSQESAVSSLCAWNPEQSLYHIGTLWICLLTV